MADLKGRLIRGGAVTITSQGIKFVLQTASIVFLAHLLSREDFGLQGMVVAMTGFLGLFRDAGLSMATVQRDFITEEQTSTLFWINFGVGVVLALLAVALAPLLVWYFKEPRLFWITIFSSAAFVFNGLAAQHQALLVRRLKYTTMAVVDLVSMGVGTVAGIQMARMGYGYWALVGMAVWVPLVMAAALWITVRWVPGPPKRGSGVRSMLHLGGTATANTVISYIGSNFEKVLLGRFWGAEPLGVYGRAYQLVNLPFQQLSLSMFNIVFPALSRIQNDPERVSRFFLKSYSLIISICIPVALSSALFSSDVIQVILGPKWNDSIPILQILAPTIVAFAMKYPFGWFLLATGRALRSLRMAIVATPILILGIALGIHHGTTGVATGYMLAHVLLIAPFVVWSIKDTGIRIKDVWNATKCPIQSGILAFMVGLLFNALFAKGLPQIPRLILEHAVVFGVYISILLFGMGQWGFYSDLIRHFVKRR